MGRGSGELSSRRRRRRNYDRERERERESWRKGVYRYSINMKYKQAKGKEGVYEACGGSVLRFPSVTKETGHRPANRLPNETKRASAEEIHPSPLSRPLSAPLPTAGSVRLLLLLEYRVARSASEPTLSSLVASVRDEFRVIRDEGGEGMRGRGKVNDCEFFKEPSRFKFLRLSWRVRDARLKILVTSVKRNGFVCIYILYKYVFMTYLK